MDYVVLAGIAVAVTDITENEPILIGDESRADDGTLRGAITAEKRRWAATPLEMTEDDFQNLRAAVALGAHVSATGEAFGVGALVVRVRIKDAAYVYLSSGGHMRVPRLEIEEV